jgi:hypothetical protein
MSFYGGYSKDVGSILNLLKELSQLYFVMNKNLGHSKEKSYFLLPEGSQNFSTV